MQKIYSFQTLPKNAQFLFEDMRAFWQYIKTSESKSNCIAIQDKGEVQINVEIGVAERIVKRKLVLILEKTITST